MRWMGNENLWEMNEKNVVVTLKGEYGK